MTDKSSTRSNELQPPWAQSTNGTGVLMAESTPIISSRASSSRSSAASAASFATNDSLRGRFTRVVRDTPGLINGSDGDSGMNDNNSDDTMDDIQVKTSLTNLLRPQTVAWFCVVLMAINVMQLIPSMVASGIINHALDTNNFSAFAVASQLQQFGSGMFLFFSYGVIAKVSAAKGQGDNREIGARLNLSLFLGLVAGSLLAVFGIVFRSSLFAIYGTTKLVVSLAQPWFIVRMSFFPISCIILVFSGVTQGIHRLFHVFLFISYRNLMDLGLTYLFLAVMGKSLVWSAVGSNIADVTSLLMFITYYHLTSKRQKYNLMSIAFFKRTDLLLSFSGDGLYMLGKGMGVVSSYGIVSVGASHLGVDQLAAVSLMVQLLVFTVYSSDALGVVATMIGSSMLGAKYYTGYIKFVTYIPLVGIALCVVTFLIMWLGQHWIITFFTDDPNVVRIMDLLWPSLLMMQTVGGLVGVYEGLCYSMNKFRFIFLVMVFDISLVLIPAVAIGSYFESNVLFVWVGMVMFVFVRLLPPVLYTYASVFLKYGRLNDEYQEIHSSEDEDDSGSDGADAGGHGGGGVVPVSHKKAAGVV
eukprot:TRINITY_DN2335_c0_g1_i1.p1 TRINITY_DN2335_c0_g1~~TRINITY_DN2335_c0_g1_i1.p1  ORF type:complete len:584 (+),score=92.67 TRINITY_DN2335_c0_g1_i1:174-1925(+)